MPHIREREQIAFVFFIDGKIGHIRFSVDIGNCFSYQSLLIAVNGIIILRSLAEFITLLYALFFIA